MVEDPKNNTVADKQILRLEALRLEKEKQAQARAQRAQTVQAAPRSAVERTLERLEAMREMGAQSAQASIIPSSPPPAPVEAPKPVDSPVVESKNPEPPPPVAAEPPPLLQPVVVDLPVVESKVTEPSPSVSAVPTPEPVIVDLPLPPPPPHPQIAPVPVPAPPPIGVSPPTPEPETPSLMDEEPVGDQPPHGDKHPSRTAFPRFDGKYKNVKLTVAQMQALEELFNIDPRLYPARILRIARNQWLGKANLPEDQAFEPLCLDALIRIRKGL